MTAGDLQTWRRYRVVDRIEESGEAFSLLLAPVEGDLPAHRTGQYVTIAVDLPGGERHLRQYTISSGPGGGSFRVTIKHVAGAAGFGTGQVSGWMHANARPGLTLEVSEPRGELVLDDSDGPLVLISAGIGVTPMAAIVEDVARRQPDREVWLLHADHSHESHALYQTVRRHALTMSRVHTQAWYERGAESAPTLRPARPGFMDLDDIDLPTDATVFLCGPPQFMRQIRTALLAKGIDDRNIHRETIGADS
ncbi:MAG: FAD-binding oxidoreductase [Micropruina sp.]|uniref:FAD-binding oxidoreductase n=1 Tax=Micropruina sp. TaxID=2737536 RepID=UPI0039E5F122